MEDTLKFSRVSKNLMEQELEKHFKETPNFIITNYLGLSSNDMNELRRDTGKMKSTYLVVKNRLCKRIMKKVKIEGMEASIDGGVGITFINGDIVEVSKSVFDFAKKHEPFKVKAGYIEGKAFDADRLKELAALPSREVLLAILFAGMKAPVTGFVNVLNNVLKSFVYVVNAIKDKKGETK